jgi:hypothetical protein
MLRNGRTENTIRIPLLFIIAIFFLIPACKTDPAEPQEQYGKLRFKFDHFIDGNPIVFDQMNYTNDAGNPYLVNEIQYFISEVKLHGTDGTKVLLDAWKDIHYVDTDIEETKSCTFKDDIEPGSFSKVSFIFGITSEKNQSLMFVNPPESLMFWPELLGGGYHYMKLNGKWMDTLNQVSPFNFHLGIGQIYYSFPDSITEFVDNSFLIELNTDPFQIKPDETTELNIVMNVENWFKNPNVYNHDDWGGDIMQKQDAMKLGCENGWNVFSLSNN